MSNRKRKYLIFSLFIFFLFPLLCFLYAYHEARNVQLREIVYRNKDIPGSFEGKKIIFVSDIHANKFFRNKDIASLVERINNRNPDIIILGGDYTEKATEYSYSFFEEIGKLKSKYGVYSVLGNHDHWEDPILIQVGLYKCGINICDNQSYWIKEGNDSIKIGGVGDFWEDNQLVNRTVFDVKNEDFCILLSHNPDYMEVLDTKLVDLMLSGHTHAGQVTLLGLYAPIMPSSMHPEYMQTGQKYRYGWIQEKGIDMYVSSGVGMGSFPLRFFAEPELVEITLQSE